MKSFPGGCVVPLVMVSACGSMSRVARLGVTQLAAGATLSVLVVVGCNNSSTPLPSAPSVPSHPASGYTLSGVVADNGHPIVNAYFNAWVELGGAGYRYSLYFSHGPLQTDASGGYRLTSLPGGAQVWVQFNGNGYVQQCAVWAIISGDLTRDVALVSRANVTASPMPSAAGLRSISGTVVEMTATGSQPVAGASVTAEAGVSLAFAPTENPAAQTYSDAAGRFTLCGLPANATVTLEAGGVGRASVEVNVAPGQTSDIQITLPSSMSSTGSMALRLGNVTIH
jgi:hypothetical protein